MNRFRFRTRGGGSGDNPPQGYAWLLYKDANGSYRQLLYKDANGNYQPLAYKVS